MARNESRNRSTIRHYRRTDVKQSVVFLYGRLGLKSKAVGHCNLHKCYLDKYNASEKRCLKKHCKHYEEIIKR